MITLKATDELTLYFGVIMFLGKTKISIEKGKTITSIISY